MAIQESLQQTHDKVSQIKSLHNTILSSPRNDPGMWILCHCLFTAQWIQSDGCNLFDGYIVQYNVITGVKQLLEKLIQSITKEMSQIGKDLKGIPLYLISYLLHKLIIFPILINSHAAAVNKAAAHDLKSGKLSETEFRMIRTVHSSLTAK